MTTTTTAEPATRRRRPPPAARWLVVPLLLAIALHVYPIRDGMTRRAILADCGLLWLNAVWLVWRLRPLRYGLLIVSALGGLVVGFAPAAHPADAMSLRDEYVAALRSYEHTKYVWGGETHRGIDCSGLLRASMVDASLRLGLHHGNPALVRQAFTVWWRDCSADELGRGYGGRTRFVLQAPSLNGLDPSRIQPGDMAVLAGGAHVMAYLGDKTWIEADPNNAYGDQVIVVRTPTKNAWFDGEARVMRWVCLEERH